MNMAAGISSNSRETRYFQANAIILQRSLRKTTQRSIKNRKKRVKIDQDTSFQSSLKTKPEFTVAAA